MSSNIRSTRRVAAAAAGIGLALATLTGASSALAASGPQPSPQIAVPGSGVTVTHSNPISLPQADLRSTTSVAIPNVTVNDPGKITSGSTVTLSLVQPAAAVAGAPADDNATGVTFDTMKTPVVTITGSGVTTSSKPQVSADGTSVSFQISKANGDNSIAASYTISNLALRGSDGVAAGTTATGAGVVRAQVSYTATSDPNGNAATPTMVKPFVVGAVTNLLPPVFGDQAPDTAGKLFRAAFPAGTAPTSIVVATDYAPQDAESASYLASALQTGIVLTDPKTLSSAVSDVLADYPSITNAYIVGGTSVVSANVENTLGKSVTTTRLAGQTAYQTNQTVVNFASSGTGGIAAANTAIAIDYTQSKYNTTSGSSSPTTTNVAGTPKVGKTAIIASGSINSFADGISSGPLSYKDGVPLLLTSPTSLDSGVRQILISGQYTQVILLGGPQAVSDNVFDQLTTTVQKGGAGVTAYRVAGADASETASLLASLETSNDAAGNAVPGFGFNTTDQQGGNGGGGVLIARGTGFQDALAGGPYAGGAAKGNTPILLTQDRTSLGASLTRYLSSIGSSGIFSVQALGGPESVTPAVSQAAINAEVSGVPNTK